MSLIIVPTNYSTIQEAIDSASNNDEILVLDGIYNESLIINKEIRIYGSNKDTVVLKGSKFKVIGISVENINVEILNLTINSFDVGIVCNSNNLKVKKCVICNCRDFGIECINDYLWVLNSEFYSNNVAIKIYSQHLYINENVFIDNELDAISNDMPDRSLHSNILKIYGEIKNNFITGSRYAIKLYTYDIVYIDIFFNIITCCCNGIFGSQIIKIKGNSIIKCKITGIMIDDRYQKNKVFSKNMISRCEMGVRFFEYQYVDMVNNCISYNNNFGVYIPLNRYTYKYDNLIAYNIIICNDYGLIGVAICKLINNVIVKNKKKDILKVEI